jgi:hypothetical protein
MQKETIRTLASIVLTQAVRDQGKESVDRLALAEHLDSELPGLEPDTSELILDMAEKLLPHVEVHVDVAFWRLEEAEHEALHNAQPKEPGAVW